MELIERFRAQLTLVDLQFRGTPELVRKAVWSCYQEKPVDFRGQALYDMGAFPGPPLSGKLTSRVTEPWKQPQDDRERAAVERMRAMVERIKKQQGKNG